MSISSAISLLLTVIVLASQVSSEPSLTRELQFTTQNPYALTIDSLLFVISKNGTHIRIVSSDKEYSPCEISVDPVEHGIPEGIRATVTESKKIIVYGVHNDSEKLLIKSVFHTILIIDPWSCELKTLNGLIQDKVPLFFPVTPAEIVVLQNDVLDVFYMGPKECAPCRFDREGKRVELAQQMKADKSTPTHFHVRKLEQNGGYAYALNLQNGSSVLKILNQDLSLLKQVLMNNSIFDFATSSSNEKSFIGATYNTPDSPYEFYYAMFNADLEPIFTNRLEELDSDHLGLNAHFNIDSKANSYVSFQQMSAETGESTVSFISYDPSGKKIGSSFEITKIPDDALYETQALLVDDSEYCHVLHKLDEPSGETKFKCIHITKE